MAKERLIDVIRQAVHELTQNGWSAELALTWERRIRRALLGVEDTSDSERRLAKSLSDLFARKTKPDSLVRVHPGIDKVTLARIAPRLRGELDQRILASVNLIRLNRKKAIEQTLQRFAGWSTSIPSSGSSAIDVREAVSHIARPLRSRSFEERRLYIDQGHKMISNIQYVLALQTEAIAVEWNSHWRQAGYDYRPDHKERDGKIYALKGNWAIEEGLMNKGAGYLEDMDTFGEKINCRCFGTYLRNLRDLPADMLTKKGREALEKSRAS